MIKVRTMDEMPLSGIHFKIFAYSGGSTFVDGYVLGIIAVVLSVMQTQMEMSVTMVGLIGMMTLVGMFVGGMFGGYLTDIVGRKKMFLIDMLILAVLSVLQFFINDPMQLVVLRFLIGVTLGMDYPIAGALMSEFAPRKYRGALLGGLNVLWYVGYAISFVVGYFMLAIGNDSWRWMLASSVVPVVILLLARLNMPESPLWLMKNDKEKEAKQTVREIFGEDVLIQREHEGVEKTSFRDIFRNGYGKITFFVSALWSLQVMTTFSIGTYIPEILAQFGFADGSREYLGSAVINMLYLIGVIPFLYFIEKVGRRPTLIWPLLICTGALLTLGITAGMNMSFGFILTFFVIYGIFNSGMGSHQWIYPYELFPTHIRATGGGFATGISRIASSISTFFFPILMDKFGLGFTMYLSSALLFLAFILSYFMAPETKNMSLEEASSLNQVNHKTNHATSYSSNPYENVR